MEYFTNEWFFSRFSEDHIETAKTEYWSYMDGIFDGLPFTIKLLAKSINLHDGIIIETSREREKLNIDLFCGDLQTGYFLLQLH